MALANRRIFYSWLMITTLLIATSHTVWCGERFAVAPDDGQAWQFSTRGRIVTMGDLHGGLDQLLTILQHSKLIDQDDHWIGGNVTVALNGDMIDGYKESLDLLNFIIRLKKEAVASGGDVIAQNAGNHELMALADQKDPAVTPSELHSYASDVGALKDSHVKRGGEVIHEALGPNSERGELFMKMGAIYSLTQSWNENGQPKSKTFMFTHGALHENNMKFTPGQLNSTYREWIKYFIYKAKALETLDTTISNGGNVPGLSSKQRRRLLKQLNKQRKELEKDKLEYVYDELGYQVKKPPENTAWVIGYDPKTQTFNRTAPMSPSWARHFAVKLDHQGNQIPKLSPQAPKPEVLKNFLDQYGADFLVVGHEPEPDEKIARKKKIKRQPRWHAGYPLLGTDGKPVLDESGNPMSLVLNDDVRIGWALMPEGENLKGQISYIEIQQGKVKTVEIPKTQWPKNGTERSRLAFKARTAPVPIAGKCIIDMLKAYDNNH
jgi:hypothetical protein